MAGVCILHSLSWIVMVSSLMAFLVFSGNTEFALEMDRAINCMACCSNSEQAFI